MLLMVAARLFSESGRTRSGSGGGRRCRGVFVSALVVGVVGGERAHLGVEEMPAFGVE